MPLDSESCFQKVVNFPYNLKKPRNSSISYLYEKVFSVQLRMERKYRDRMCRLQLNLTIKPDVSKPEFFVYYASIASKITIFGYGRLYSNFLFFYFCGREMKFYHIFLLLFWVSDYERPIKCTSIFLLRQQRY